MAQRKLRQPEIPGTERPRIDEIEEPASEYIEIVEARKELQQREAKVYDTLHAALEEHAPDGYVYVDGEYEYPFRRTSKTKYRYKRKQIGAPVEDNGDDEGGEE